MKKIGSEFENVDDLLAKDEKIRSSNDIAELKKILDDAEKSKSSIVEFLKQLPTIDINGFDEKEVEEINKKFEKAHVDDDRLKALIENLLQQIEALEKWMKDKDELTSGLKPVIDEGHALIERYSNAQPFENVGEDVKAIERIADCLLSAQKQAEKACENLRLITPNCERAINEANNLAEELSSEASKIQVSNQNFVCIYL